MTSNDEIPQTPDTQKASKDEIDLIELTMKLWKERKTIIRFAIIGMVIGLIIALFSPKEYMASTIMIPQTENSSSSKLGGLSSLAAMAGFNMNSVQSTVTLSPLIYPQIVNSIPFQLDLLQASYSIPDLPHPINLITYYSDVKGASLMETMKKYTIGLPGIIIQSIKGTKKKSYQSIADTTTFIHVSKEQERIRKKLIKQVSIEINEKDGYITLSSRFDNPELAAQVTRKTQQLLQSYITKLKIEKATEKLKFIEARYLEKKEEFETAQKNLATFRDRNKNMASAMALTEEDRLQSNYELAYSVYSELAKQLEQTKIQVKEETPVFSIIQPVQIPTERTKPNRPLIMIIWLMLGLIVGIAVAISKYFFTDLKQKWHEKRISN